MIVETILTIISIIIIISTGRAVLREFLTDENSSCKFYRYKIIKRYIKDEYGERTFFVLQRKLLFIPFFYCDLYKSYNLRKLIDKKKELINKDRLKNTKKQKEIIINRKLEKDDLVDLL